MVDWTDALLLAVVQGVTEFLPISSSGHLVLMQAVLGWEEPDRNLAFAALLHLPSALAILVYYAREWARLLGPNQRELGRLLLATIPAAVAGLALKDVVASVWVPAMAAANLLVTALVLAGAQRTRGGTQTVARLGWWRALAVGMAQAVAILPGISRSAVTIATGLACRLTPAEAVRFSFFLGAPLMIAAAIVGIRDMPPGQLFAGPTALALVACFALSLVAIRVVEWLAAARRFGWLAAYCAAVGVVALLRLTG